jgi:hypothetical protein
MHLEHPETKILELREYITVFPWSPLKLERERDYPEKPSFTVIQPMWSMDETMDYATERIRLHKFAATTPDEDLECSDEERWAQPEKWAVTKLNSTGEMAKRALKLHDTEHEARAYAAQSKHRTAVTHRPGKANRCRYWCPVKDFCTQKDDSNY